MKYGKDTTGVIFGVLRELQGTIRMFKDSNVVIAADSQKSLRRDLFPGYKNRIRKEETEQEKDARWDAIRQINLLKREILPAIGIRNVFEYDGYEADDVMAELVFNKNSWSKPTIITGDQDLFQMLPYANMWIATKKQKVTADKFIEMYGIPSQLWSEVKAIAGCSSDTVPGVKGIGEVTAIKYLTGKLPGGSKRKSIEDAEKSGHLELMRKLVVLPFKDTPRSTIFPTRFNKDGFLDVCSQYGLNTLADDVDVWVDLLKRR